jgi:hypothetical protein
VAQAAGYKYFIQFTFLFQCNLVQDCIDGFFLGFVYETTGINDSNMIELSILCTVNSLAALSLSTSLSTIFCCTQCDDIRLILQRSCFHAFK